MRFRTSIVLILAGVFAFSMFQNAWSIEVTGFFVDSSGMPIDSISVPGAEPVTLDFALFPTDFQEVGFYSLKFEPSAAQLLDWQDAQGAEALVHPLNWEILCYYPPTNPILLPPEPTVIGTMTFLPAGPTTLVGDPSNSFVFGSGESAINFLPLEIIFGAAPPPEIPDPPPMPSNYQMGTVANGNFEANGGSIDGWSDSTTYESTVQAVTLTSDHSDTVARLHSEGQWEPGMFYEDYWGGECSLSQEIYVPVDADEVTFTYCTREKILLSDGATSASVLLGNNWADIQEVSQSEVWTTYTLSVPEEMRGRRQRLLFSASDWGYDIMTSEEDHNSLDFYIDYVGINGTTVLQTVTWAATGGGAWSNSGNWDLGTVPDNTTASAYDVVVPETTAGGDITISTVRTVQSLDYARSSGALAINPGGSLYVKDFMTVTGGSVNVHPTGSSSGGTALSVDGTLRIEASGSGQAASLSIQDALVTTESLTVVDSNVNVSRSAGFSGQPCLEGKSSISLTGSEGSHLSLGSGTSVVTPVLNISANSSLTVEDATISDGSSGGSSSITNQGLATFHGQCLVDQDMFTNRGQLVFEDADTTFTGSLSHSYGSDCLSLIRSTVTVEGSFYTSSAAAGLSVDADSVLRVHENFNGSCGASQFDFEAGTLLFTGAEASNLYVDGLNQGPFSFGFDENYGLGNLVVEQGTVTLQQDSTGHAQYLYNLTIASGTTLDLNGIPLYCLGTFTNEGQVIGGEIRQAYVQAEGLPTPGVTSYTISGTANDESDSSVDSPLTVTGWRTVQDGWFEEIEEAYARAEGSVAHEENHCRLSLKIQGNAGRAYDGSFYEERIPTDASVEIEAMLEVEANDIYGVGTEVELLVLTAHSSYSADNWGVDVYRGTELIASWSSGTTEITLDATIGETLRFEAWLSDSTLDGFTSSLDVRVYTLSAVPEPGSITLLGLAMLVVAVGPTRRTRRRAK